MAKRKKIIPEEAIPEFEVAINSMPKDSQIFIDKSMEISDYITSILEKRNLMQKDLAQKMGKTEAEISKLLSGLHNFTLRSIAKIEAALGTPIISVPPINKFEFKESNFRIVTYHVFTKNETESTTSIRYGKSNVLPITGKYCKNEQAAI
jgi:transcriptional regulator with XRE-family HTH domain